MKKLAPSFAALAVLGLALTGCSFSFSAGATPSGVSSDKVSELAEDALEEQVGQRPDIDCGDEEFPLEDGATRTCLLTDPASGTEYDAEVTLSDVEGTTFHVGVEVATQANP